ncbi:hypothetical protein K0M31_009707 [Melipona bicolor]|uniref:Uncharacterized protein n=1 Tax=Melipona bicolor TaxID=60889 RepID=A0AA40FNQ5_9HYME|nr:hypothetical protein K0M31_009707 [Melipona bicolor]
MSSLVLISIDRSHSCNISVQNSNDKNCINRKKKEKNHYYIYIYIYIPKTQLDFLKNQFSISLRLEKLGKKISHRYRLFIVTIMRPRLSNACIHEFFTIDKTMELSVFYCTMHSSIENLFTSSHNKILS